MVPNFRIQLRISSSSCYYYEEPHPAPAGLRLALSGRQSISSIPRAGSRNFLPSRAPSLVRPLSGFGCAGGVRAAFMVEVFFVFGVVFVFSFWRETRLLFAEGENRVIALEEAVVL
jgi:hypothetical protein